MQPPKQIAVLGSFLTNAKSLEYQMAEELGCLLARSGFSIICGGHGGIATPLAAGVNKAGGTIRGISLPESRYPKRSAQATSGVKEIVQVQTLSERLEALAGASGYIVFSGGIGTLAEFAFIWHSLQIEGDFEKPIAFLSSSWRRFLADFKHGQMAKFKYYRHVHLCESVQDAVATVTRDYALKYADSRKHFRKECILFELDGTIVESVEEQFVKSCENLGCFFQLPDVIESMANSDLLPPKSGTGIRHYETILKKLGLTTRAATEFAEDLDKEAGQTPGLYADAAETLQHFKQKGFATGVASSLPGPRVLDILNTHKLAGLVDFSCPLRDRDAQQICAVIESRGFKKHEVIYVSANLQDDCLAARAANLDAILLDRHLNYLDKDIAFKVRSLDELRYFIDRMQEDRPDEPESYPREAT